MAFEKGNKVGKGGVRKGAGRPTRIKREINAVAAVLAKRYIERHIAKVLRAYLQLAAGRNVKHYNQQSGQYIYHQWEVDGPTLRHWIDKVVPAETSIKHSGTINTNDNRDLLKELSKNPRAVELARELTELRIGLNGKQQDATG